MGIKAFDGQGEPVNHSKAAGYFERAAQLNLAEAQMMLGQMYENGLFYTANLETAKNIIWKPQSRIMKMRSQRVPDWVLW
ncbi:MAG: sel1 repeat family protein [Bacteroidota bacterium]|nr:MAG: sel1 repeat family protein [Bacteroidota bacterium]